LLLVATNTTAGTIVQQALTPRPLLYCCHCNVTLATAINTQVQGLQEKGLFNVDSDKRTAQHLAKELSRDAPQQQAAQPQLSHDELVEALVQKSAVPLPSAVVAEKLRAALQQNTIVIAQAERCIDGRPVYTEADYLDTQRFHKVPNTAKGKQQEQHYFGLFDPAHDVVDSSKGRVWCDVTEALAAGTEPVPPLGYQWCRQRSGALVSAEVDVAAWAHAIATGRYAGRMLQGINNLYVTATSDGKKRRWWQRESVPGVKIPCCIIIIIWWIICFGISISNPQADGSKYSFGDAGGVELSNASDVRGGEYSSCCYHFSHTDVMHR
jgi:hypothetical protein